LKAKPTIDLFVGQLQHWFEREQRPMPWRQQPSPYSTWISEMMLQQTQVVTVIPYFARFMAKFPTIADLAQADLQEVLKVWEGLGYYSRARFLHKTAKILFEIYDSQLPESYEECLKLPGIGPYCAAAIVSIAYEKPVPVVDGNVLRVFTRFWGIYDDITQPKVRGILFEKLKPYCAQIKPSVFNQGIMELGALICTPTNPRCDSCPISSECFAFNAKKTADLPVKTKKAKVPHHDIAVAIVRRLDMILIAKRKEGQMLAGLWEFPGGKVEPNETIEQALHRELNEEVNITVRINYKRLLVKHAFSHFKISLHVYDCKYLSGDVKALSSDEIKWVCLDELQNYPFPTANKKIIEDLMRATA
jgi:A/G-specific adenine glycosylase